ncbi:hypothetical protein ACFV0O_13290 [Kitasatospora sp. NPDC059577]|uniref:hypothetical protein n=1 Tax=Kitasatospora sp. NPDC059577 TaxID=3346873 RepID=UPI00368D4873
MWYVDDSGIPKTGLALYTAIGASPVLTPEVLADWQNMRHRWNHEHSVPVGFELHATDFLGGRGRPGGLNPPKIERYRMAQEALSVIGSWPSLDIVTVYAEEPSHWGTAKRRAYEGLLRRLDRRLAEIGEPAGLIVDGDGTEGLYEEVHRLVNPRWIPLPAAQAPADTSEWLQMADLVAHAACQSIARQEAKRMMWGWFGRYLPKAPAPERS